MRVTTNNTEVKLAIYGETTTLSITEAKSALNKLATAISVAEEAALLASPLPNAKVGDVYYDKATKSYFLVGKPIGTEKPGNPTLWKLNPNGTPTHCPAAYWIANGAKSLVLAGGSVFQGYVSA